MQRDWINAGWERQTIHTKNAKRHVGEILVCRTWSWALATLVYLIYGIFYLMAKVYKLPPGGPESISIWFQGL